MRGRDLRRNNNEEYTRCKSCTVKSTPLFSASAFDCVSSGCDRFNANRTRPTRWLDDRRRDSDRPADRREKLIALKARGGRNDDRVFTTFSGTFQCYDRSVKAETSSFYVV